jgi:hypothetical protein
MMYYFQQFIYWITYPLRMLFYAPGQLLAGSKRLGGISLPARVAILTFLFLIICAVVTVVLFIKFPGRSFAYAKLTPGFYIVVSILLILIPLVLYKALKLWLEGETSPFPDIDHAWKTGLAELQRQGLDLGHTPLFLVLGSAGTRQEKALFSASQLNLNVKEFPSGPAALHWFANPDGVYLVCSETSCLSKVSNLGTKAAEEALQSLGPISPSSSPRSNENALRGTIIAGPASDRETPEGPRPSPSKPPASPPAPGRRAMAAIQGTMILDSGGDADADRGRAPTSGGGGLVKLAQQDASEMERRLQYLCKLIRRARQTLAPLNGILTLLPFSLIQKSDVEANEVSHAVKRDLGVLRRTLMLRCPVTALVVELEEESGFGELVRRVGRDRAVGQRFGRGFTLSNPPISERLEALCAHACGSFEDWVYSLFEKDTLKKQGNAKLYALLCKIRLYVRSRLEDILVNGFGFDPDKKDVQNEIFFFGGCYFAATGETEDRQAFVKGVFDKLPEQQEELEWTEDAIRQDQKFQLSANLGLCLDMVLFLGLAALVVYKWWWQ